MKKVTFIFLCFLGIVKTQAQETLQSVSERGNATTERLGLENGAYVENWDFTVYGETMGYRDPFKVTGNLDGAAAILSDGALRFDRSNDLFEPDGSALAFVYPPSGIPYIRRYGTDFTILKIWSPTASRHAYESTLALVNGDNEEEYLDLYNMNYPSNSSFGIRMQKRGTGNYKKFHFEYSNGDELYKVLSLAPDSTARFYGNVGISTDASADHMLAVGGSIISEEVEVKLQSEWPDYVFEPEYDLISLEELEQYVSKNKRLPNVPSAQDIKNNGLKIGEMEASLMEKIEEITLHLIEQNRRIKVLEQENMDLKKIIAHGSTNK